MGAQQRARWVLAAACGLLAVTATPSISAAQRQVTGVAVPRTAQASQAYEAGLREGAHQGEADARGGRDANVDRDEVYRAGDRGYTRNAGDRDAYRTEFRRGFAVGYRQAYERVSVQQQQQRQQRRDVPRDAREARDDTRDAREDRREVRDERPDDRRNGRGARGYQEPAAARGYSDGFDRGREDARGNERYDPARHGDYRDADEGYQREYGSKDTYRNNYRAGFRQGYDDGYRQGNRR